MVKTSKAESGTSTEKIKDDNAKNGSANFAASPKSFSPPRFGPVRGWKHKRSATLDNAFLMDERKSLDHSDIEERHSLPSIDHLESDDEEVPTVLEDGIPPELLDILANPSIEDNTPAAEALRANAEIKVRKVGKLARRVHGQSVRRVVKRATLRSKSGRVRGKPPRIPPARAAAGTVPAGPDNEIYVVHEESEDIAEEDELDSSIESSEQDADYRHHHDDEANLFVAAAGHIASEDEEPVIEEVEHVAVDKVPDWQTRLTEESPDSVPAEVLTATMETGKKVLGRVDPHDILQQHRWKRRKRKGNKKDERKSYVKGKVINGQHELYTLSIAVMLGVRTSIGTTNARMSASGGRHWLTSDDFMASEKYEFSPKGGPRTPPHQLHHTFKFKDYSPMAFAYLRRMFGVNEFDFLLSVCGNANFIEFISNAKSGQFFFYSSDGKYMIKTMTNDESKFLRRILPHYFRHCAKNPNTLLTKFLGMYRVKMYHLRRNVKFVIMNSVYYTDKPLSLFYDLKGSVLGREAKPNQDVKKDNDLRKGMPDSAIALPKELRERMREQIVADCEFMRKMDIMDYSMLIGIHHIPPAQERSIASDSMARTGFSISSRRRDSLRELMRKKRLNSTSLTDHEHLDLESDMMSPGRKVRASTASSISSRESQNTTPLKDSGRQRTQLDEQITALHLYDQGYDEDDDISYLEGSEEFKRACVRSSAATEKSSLVSKVVDASIEQKKLQTVEQIYWPFHRYYDINGYRRMVPAPCAVCSKVDCACGKPADFLANLEIPAFVPPLSSRKDGGLMMDTTGFEMPIKVSLHGNEVFCDGKIFYVGIIDVLQQYNVRKRFEARYRQITSRGWENASCVHPRIYADRFVRFFDEYSQRHDESPMNPTKNGASQTVPKEKRDQPLADGEEQVVFTHSKDDSVKITGSTSSLDIEISHLKQE